MNGCKAMADSTTPKLTLVDALRQAALPAALSLDHFHPPLPFAVALSGGADSCALLLACAKQWPGQVRAVPVHHGLQNAADLFGDVFFASNIDEATKLLAQNAIDVVFLDIQLKGDIGFSITQILPPNTHVVVVSAFPEYAMQAIKLEVIDYLLKPISEDDFISCAVKSLTDQRVITTTILPPGCKRCRGPEVYHS